MSNPLFFVQECPTCGRSLYIRVAYLGRRVVCQHCNGHLEACDPASAAYPPCDSSAAILKRADELLETIDRRTSKAS
ncbi:MAG TPA: hypothetical protein VGY55_16145 [Pirellulales bacterium]|nr:hypothetical protein [Pirellulales bacterium]